MYFKELSLKDFRNYPEVSVQFHPKVNIITGENAQGKTNLIEALYLMSLGKSFRTFRDGELIAFGKDFCRARSLFEKEGQESSLEFIISAEGKEIRSNGVRLQKNSELLENVYTVIFSPEDLKIVKEEPEKRRKFMDRELCMMDPVYYKTLGRYKKALVQRNNLLREDHPNKDVIMAWSEAMAKEGAKITLRRNAFVKRLSEVSSDLHSKITQGKELLSLEYESDLPVLENEAAQTEYYYEKMQKDLEKDLFRRTTGSGPHKDDIKISIGGIDARHYGSQGQQRTAALSLKLAEIALIREETGEDAVLLLDDVLSELDPNRQTFLLQSLSHVQLFITTAELSEGLLQKLPEYRIFVISGGQVEKQFDNNIVVNV